MIGARVRSSTPADGWLVYAATGALAAGSVLALAGVMGRAPMTAMAGAFLLCAATVVLLTADLVSGALLVAAATPLPAVFDSGSVRVAAVAPVAAMAVFAWLLKRLMDREAIRGGQLPLRTLAALTGAMALAALFSDDVAAGAREVLNFVVLAAFLLAATDELLEHGHRRQTVIDALVAAAAICGALAVLEAIGVIPGNFPRWGTSYHRAALGFGQPNGLGLFIAIILPLSIHRAARSIGAARLWWSGCVLLAGIGLIATFSRASWIAAIAGVAALALLGRARPAGRALLGLIAFLVTVDVASGGMIRDTIARTAGDWVLEQRAALFIAGVQMFLAHPLTGIGPGAFGDQVQQYAARITQLWDYQPTPHNAYVQMAAETGIIGLIAFVAFLTAAFRALRNNARNFDSERVALFISFTILAVASLGIWPFSHGTGEAVMLLLALGCSQERAV